MSITFDNIILIIASFFNERIEDLRTVGKILVNRDMTGRVCLIMEARCEYDEALQQTLKEIRYVLSSKISPHIVAEENFILFEDDLNTIMHGIPTFPVQGVELDIHVIDRLVSGTEWSREPLENSPSIPRFVFFSIKGGVGRSTALAVTAHALAEAGKKVLVLDLDLESPGLSSALLPEDRRPEYGIVDWLVEDLVGNGDTIFADMGALSPLSRDGVIWVVPAHGKEPGEYIAKLGRIWVPKWLPDGNQEGWADRLCRLLKKLEERMQPDVVLIDSRAGIDDVASACVTSLGARRVLLFAIDGAQTWQGYSILFDHWQRYGHMSKTEDILQIVAALVPDMHSRDYLEILKEHSYNIFSHVYETSTENESEHEYSYNLEDTQAPHYPWAVMRNNGFEALYSLHDSENLLNKTRYVAHFAELIDGITDVLGTEG